MMPWSLELEVLAWLCSSIHIELPHNQLNGRHVEIPNPEFFDDSIPMELSYTLYEWLKCTFLHLKVYSRPWKSYTISSVSQSSRVVTCSEIFSLKTAEFPILDTYPWPWNHHPWMQTIIHVFFWFPLFYCNVSFRNALLSIVGSVNSIPQHHQPPSLSFFLWFFPYFIAILHLA